MVAGANSYRQMHEFIRIHLQRLNGAFQGHELGLTRINGLLKA